MKHLSHIYHQNDFACAGRCHCHNELHLIFGNISLLISVYDFFMLRAQVRHTYQKVQGKVASPVEKDILVNTSVCNMVFLFSFQDLSCLKEVMDQTAMILEVEGILHG
jgi:hypothetical protein